MQKISKWDREQNASLYKEQLLFNKNAELVENDYHNAVKIIHMDMSKKVLCPFCLELNHFYKFLIYKNEKVNHYLCMCPNCKRQQHLKTIAEIDKMNTPQEFAKHVFDYNFGRNAFFNRVYPDFPTWCLKLRNLGLSYDFWLEYKKLKGENNYVETFEE